MMCKVKGFPGGSIKDHPAIQESGFDPWVRKIPWRREWLLTPVFLPGESHGQRSLVGCRPWDHQESRHDRETNTHVRL